MKIQFKRIVSAVCALALCVSMMPTSALAEDNPVPESAGTSSTSTAEDTTLDTDGLESTPVVTNDLTPAAYGGSWSGGNSYVWNVATITPKRNDDGYSLAAAQGDVNNAANVTVSISDSGADDDWQEINAGNAKDQTYNEQYIKIEANPGYYIQYVVVACNDNKSGNYDGLNCRSVGNGAAYTTSGGVGVSTIKLDTKTDGFYHKGMGDPYHILIQLAESPNPVYAVYEAGKAGEPLLLQICWEIKRL